MSLVIPNISLTLRPSGIITAMWLLLLGLWTSVSQPARAQENLRFDFAYTGEYWANARGGIEQGYAWLTNLDLTLSADLAGGTFFAYALANNGTELSRPLIGDAQVVSNIDNSEMSRLYELWYSRGFWDDLVTAKAGVMDLNADFNVIDTASYFINSSHGIDPTFSLTGRNGPSIFPATSLGASLRFAFGENWDARVAVYDAVPHDPDRPQRTDFSLGDGSLLASELNYFADSGLRIGIGLWSYSGGFETNYSISRAESVSGNSGFYAFGESRLFENPTSSAAVDGWLRLGVANQDLVNLFSESLAGGLVFSGFMADRPDDSFGVAFSSAAAGNAAQNAASADGDPIDTWETNLEIFYRAEITSWLTVTPDIQYTINPGLSPQLEDSLAVGLRFQLF